MDARVLQKNLLELIAVDQGGGQPFLKGADQSQFFPGATKHR